MSKRNSQTRHIKNEEMTPDYPAMLPCGLGTTPRSRARFTAALSPATAHASATTIHRRQPASQPRIHRYVTAHGRPQASSLHSQPCIQRYIIARGWLDASSSQRSSALRLQPVPLGKAQQHKQLIPATELQLTSCHTVQHETLINIVTVLYCGCHCEQSHSIPQTQGFRCNVTRRR